MILVLGVKFKALADAAENYHSVLAENRKLFNEVQDLKGATHQICFYKYVWMVNGTALTYSFYCLLQEILECIVE